MNKTWDSFERVIYINSTLQEVYNCFAIPEQIEIWFLKEAKYQDATGILRPKTEPVKSGDKYTFSWYIYTGLEHGEILEANGKDHFSFTFVNSVVDVKLKEDMGMTLLTLTQKEIAEDDETKMNIYTGCSNGWTFWITNLKAWLEHKILLHEKEGLPLQLSGNHNFING